MECELAEERTNKISSPESPSAVIEDGMSSIGSGGDPDFSWDFVQKKKERNSLEPALASEAQMRTNTSNKFLNNIFTTKRKIQTSQDTSVKQTMIKKKP